jgi:hypothetical protein
VNETHPLPDDVYLAAHLQEHLAKDERVHELELRLSVIDGRILVEGVVPTAARQAAVRDVLVEACPDHLVDDRTSVASYDPPDDEERIS